MSTANRTSSGVAAVFAVVLCANGVALLNLAGLSVAATNIGTALSAPANLAMLVPSAFLAAIASAIPMTPMLLRRWGPRRLLIAALSMLALFSGAAALSQNIWQLMAACFAQGLAAAPIAPTTQALVAQELPEERRGLGMALWGVGSYVGFLAGPWIGGHVVEAYGFPWLFLVGLLPVACSALLCLRLPVVPVAREAAWDFASLFWGPAAVLSVIGVVSFGAELGWFRSSVVWGLLGAAAFIFIPLYVRSFVGTTDPALDLRPVRSRNVAVALVMLLVLNICSSGFFETEFLASADHESVGALGLRGSLGGVAMLLGLLLGGRIAATRFARLGLYVGMVAMLIGKYGFTRYGLETSFVLSNWTNAVTAFAFGLITTSMATLAYVGTDEKDAPSIASLFVLASYFGSSLGVGALDAFVSALNGDGDTELVAFHTEFWLEFGMFLPLLALPFLFQRNAALPSKAT